MDYESAYNQVESILEAMKASEESTPSTSTGE